MLVQFLGRENPLEKGMATHSSILDWRISWTEVPDRLQSMGLQRVGHGWATNSFKKTNKVDEIQEIQNTAKNKPYSLSLLNDGTNSNYFVLEKLPFMLSPSLCCYHYCFCLSSFQAHDRNAMSYHAMFVVRYGHVGEGNGTPLQYSCLENPMDGGAW